MGGMIRYPNSCLGSLLVLGLVLNVAVVSNAGKSTTFVRKVEKAVDMPLDSDVFRLPPGHNAPQQVLPATNEPVYFLFFLLLRFLLTLYCFKVHITQGDHVGKGVIVSWVTPISPGSSSVVYWTENSKHKYKAKGIVTKYKYYNYTSGYIHHCTIKNLEVSCLIRSLV